MRAAADDDSPEGRASKRLARGRRRPAVAGLVVSALGRSFAFMSRNAEAASAYFGIAPEQVVELGAQYDL